MHLLSCLHPKRVYNKYSKEYVWVACRECEACRNSRAAKWTSAIERERSQHRFSLFVTLTYSENHLPVLDFGSWEGQSLEPDTVLYPSKADDFTMNYSDFQVLFEDSHDRELFEGLLDYGGIPYCSSSDLQKFLKRLNKYIYDHITHSFKNFRYFICSEYGSTTFRPHYHGIFFVDDSKVAESFEECVLHTWKLGRIDCQYVEKSAGAYVAQYVNKSANLPRFYKTGKIRQRFYFSRQPTIGDVPESCENVQKILDHSIISRVSQKENGFVDVPLCPSLQNRLFGRCFSYRSVSNSTRIKLYTINRRFGATSVKDLYGKVLDFCKKYYLKDEFEHVLITYVRDLIQDDLWTKGKAVYNFVRRLYYTSNDFLNNARLFGYTATELLRKIVDYWDKKELRLLKEFYTFQEEHSQYDSDSLVLMYPEFCYQNFGKDESFEKAIKNYNPLELITWSKDSKHWDLSNHLTHLKNAYIDTKCMFSDNPFIYKLLKKYHYAKKCNEACEAFAS